MTILIPEHGLLRFTGFCEVCQCKKYYCTGVKLRLLSVYIEILAMSLQFCLYSERTCVDVRSL